MKREMVALYGVAAILGLLVMSFAMITAPKPKLPELVHPDDNGSQGTVVAVTKSGEDSSGNLADTTQTNVSQKININTATKEDLMTLTGIGEVLAQRILDYRVRYHGFSRLEELMEVDGIGEKRFEAIRPYITL